MKTNTDILVIYYYYESFGPTVMDHIMSFKQYSKFDVTMVNIAEPNATTKIRKLNYKSVVMHYTLFGLQYYAVPDEITYLIAQSNAITVCFFQDEYHNCPKRFRYIDEIRADIVYTLLEPQHFNETYYRYTQAPVVRHTLAGYVSETLIRHMLTLEEEGLKKDIDVGYRGNELDISYGLGGREKHTIASDFALHTQQYALKLDIETRADQRIYGDDWYRFIGRCKGMLGVEAGVSAFDLDDGIRIAVRETRLKRPDITDEEVHATIVAPYENNIPYRTISPRHFEAAALGTCQILFEGKYTGLLDPNIHYIPLKKDFSNIHEVIKKFQDDNCRQTIAENAKRDLVDSGRYSYREFVLGVERDIKLLGLKRRTA